MTSKMMKTYPARYLFLGVLLAVHAGAQAIDEYQVKAAFLYNFAKFVEWPPDTFKSDKDPIRICVLGQDPFGRTLTDATDGKTVLGRSFSIRDISASAQAPDCEIVFVSSSERRRQKTLLAELRTKGLLTVGESAGFAAQGGIVNFKMENGRVRLEINMEAAERANLRISSKVLNLSEIVRSDAPK